MRDADEGGGRNSPSLERPDANMDTTLLEQTAGGERVVLRPTKSVLHAEAAESLYEQLSRLADEPGGRDLHLDLGGVEYLAPVVLYKLLALEARLRESGGGLR